MDDKTLQKKLNQLAKICNELDAEAKRRYGDSGNLFFEADGSFHLMRGDGDPDSASRSERQSYIVASSEISCRLGAGAW